MVLTTPCTAPTSTIDRSVNLRQCRARGTRPRLPAVEGSRHVPLATNRPKAGSTALPPCCEQAFLPRLAKVSIVHQQHRPVGRYGNRNRKVPPSRQGKTSKRFSPRAGVLGHLGQLSSKKPKPACLNSSRPRPRSTEPPSRSKGRQGSYPTRRKTRSYSGYNRTEGHHLPPADNSKCGRTSKTRGAQ